MGDVKSKKDEIVTKGFLDETLQELRVQIQKEFLSMREEMYTKGDHQAFVSSLRMDLQRMKEELRAEMYTKSDHQAFMSLMDEMMTEVRDARDERMLKERQQLRMDDKLDNHEKRLCVLERE